jgi:hypothetical protein
VVVGDEICPKPFEQKFIIIYFYKILIVMFQKYRLYLSGNILTRFLPFVPISPFKFSNRSNSGINVTLEHSLLIKGLPTYTLEQCGTIWNNTLLATPQHLYIHPDS